MLTLTNRAEVVRAIVILDGRLICELDDNEDEAAIHKVIVAALGIIIDELAAGMIEEVVRASVQEWRQAYDNAPRP